MNARIAAMLVPLAVLVGMIACSSGKPPTNEAPGTQPMAAPESEQPAQAPATPRPTATSLPPTPTTNPNLVNPGTYIVGSDIQPGIYRGEAGRDLLDSCYWARLRDLSGQFDAILANDNSVGQFYIELAATDFALETSCQLVFLPSLPEPPADFPPTIQPGTYLVGIDIQAGTYQGQAGQDFSESCYWARLDSLSGGFESIIANDNAVGQFYIQVAASDAALNTRCELTRVGD
jgi:hypothetical protein